MIEADTAMSEGAREEWFLMVERFIQFMQIWTVYRDYRSGHYEPSVGDDDRLDTPYQMGTALLFVVYAFFYSLIEEYEQSLNAFRIWRVKFPDEVGVIDAVEKEAKPMRDDLRLFRNRLGFHGSRTAARRECGFELFAKHSGTKMWNVIVDFKALGATLLAKDTASHQGNRDALATIQKELEVIRRRAALAINAEPNDGSAAPSPSSASA